MQQFKERLSQAMEMSPKNMKGTQIKMKDHDVAHKVVKRNFKLGELVLAFVPQHEHPFRSKFGGPYTVIERESPVNYVIATPEGHKKKRLVHVNRLKRYHVRGENFGEAVVNNANSASVQIVPSCQVVPESEKNSECILDGVSGL